MAPVVRVAPTFGYRAGVRVRDSVLACDTAAGGDLTFLSHAAPAASVGARRAPRARAGRRKILATEATLALLGPAGDRLRPHALTAAFGRPFALGGLRIELFPSGFLPGAASLLCERDGERLVYSGPIGPTAEPGAASAARGAPEPATRVAGALCIDGTFGSPRFVFPPQEEALAEVEAFVRQSLGSQRAPVLLGEAAAPLLAAAARLDRLGIPLRAHRRIMAAAAAFRRAGAAVPALLRFGGALRPGEALLWPADARDAPMLGTVAEPRFAFTSGWAADPATVGRMRADAAIRLAGRADFAGLLRYVEATAAREVAVQHAQNGDGDGDGELCQALRARGVDAYPVGPPLQIALFPS
jgi:putative mRNA 3-end processing factor